jgi:AdoMet-dependent heme synthase
MLLLMDNQEQSMQTDEPQSRVFTPRLVFWELTTACNLKCVHCRACPVEQRSPEDLTTEQGIALLDEIAAFAKPAVVLSGGEPLVRPDVF